MADLQALRDKVAAQEAEIAQLSATQRPPSSAADILGAFSPINAAQNIGEAIPSLLNGLMSLDQEAADKNTNPISLGMEKLGDRVMTQPLTDTAIDVGEAGATAASMMPGYGAIPKTGIALSGLLPMLQTFVKEQRGEIPPQSVSSYANTGSTGAWTSLLGKAGGDLTNSALSSDMVGNAFNRDAINDTTRATKPGKMAQQYGVGSKLGEKEIAINENALNPKNESLFTKEKLLQQNETPLGHRNAYAKRVDDVSALKDKIVDSVDRIATTLPQGKQPPLIQVSNDAVAEINDQLKTLAQDKLEGVEPFTTEMRDIWGDITHSDGTGVISKQVPNDLRFGLKDASQLLTNAYKSLKAVDGFDASLKVAQNVDPSVTVATQKAREMLTEFTSQLRQDVAKYSKNVIQNAPQTPQNKVILDAINKDPLIVNFDAGGITKLDQKPFIDKASGALDTASYHEAAGKLSADPSDVLDNVYQRLHALLSFDYPVNQRGAALEASAGAQQSPISLRAGANPAIEALKSGGRSLLNSVYNTPAVEEANKLAYPDNLMSQLSRMQDIRNGSAPMATQNFVGRNAQSFANIPRANSVLANTQSLVSPDSSSPLAQSLPSGQSLLDRGQTTSLPLTLAPTSKAVMTNKDALLGELQQRLGDHAQEVISQLQPALDAKDPDKVGAVMASMLHAFPETRSIFGDDPDKSYVVFNGKVYTPEDKAAVEQEISDSSASINEKARRASALNKDGSVLR